MSVTIVQGDLFLTQAGAIALDLNATGRLGVAPVYTALQDRYPVFVSECHKRGRADSLTPGSLWVWRESDPWLVGLVVRETPQGPTRLRYVENVMLNLYQAWEREGIRSLAMPRFGTDEEWPGVREVVLHYAAQMTLPITLYEVLQPSVAAENPEP